MIRDWLSRYNWRYPRSLIYMLQASEYNVGDFLSWYHRTKNFNKVEQRKRLVKTPKAILFLIDAWVILLVLYLIGFLFLFLSLRGSGATVAIFILLVFGISVPFLLAYLIALKSFLFNFVIQKPAEYFIIKKARNKLAAHKGFKIAIAGSFGKTSMREILKAALGEGKKVAAPSENYNTPIGISRFIKKLKGDEEILIFEFGEYYPGDIRQLCRLVQPQLAVITGVNEAHLKRFKTIDRAAKTIFELSYEVELRKMYVNGESELAKKYAPQGSVFYSRQGAEDLRTSLSGTSFIFRGIKINSQLLGLHQVGPLSVAVAIALYLGIAPELIQEGIKKIKPLPHRLNPQTSGEAIIIDDSYNGSPDGAAAAINFLASLKNRRRIYMTPGLVEMGERTKIVHRQIGWQLAEAKIEKVVLIKNSVTPFIAEGLREKEYVGEIKWFENGPEAFAAIPFITAKNDVVLIQNDWPDQYE